MTDMYYISHLGVEESARGQGLGSALVRHIVDKAHREGVPVCLLTMTEKNVSADRRAQRAGQRAEEWAIGGVTVRRREAPCPQTPSCPRTRSHTGGALPPPRVLVARVPRRRHTGHPHAVVGHEDRLARARAELVSWAIDATPAVLLAACARSLGALASSFPSHSRRGLRHLPPTRQSLRASRPHCGSRLAAPGCYRKHAYDRC